MVGVFAHMELHLVGVFAHMELHCNFRYYPPQVSTRKKRKNQDSLESKINRGQEFDLQCWAETRPAVISSPYQSQYAQDLCSKLSQDSISETDRQDCIANILEASTAKVVVSLVLPQPLGLAIVFLPMLHPLAAVQVNISQRCFLGVCTTCWEANLCPGEWKAAPGEVVIREGFVCKLCEGPRKTIADKYPFALGFDVSKKQLSPNITELDKVVITPHDERKTEKKAFWEVAKALNWREKLFLARVNFNNRATRFSRGGGELAFGKDCWFGKRDLGEMLKGVWGLLPRTDEILPPDHPANSVEFEADLVLPPKNSSEEGKRYSIRPYYIKAVAEYLAENCPAWNDPDDVLGTLQVPDATQLGLLFKKDQKGSLTLPKQEPLPCHYSEIRLLQTCAFPLVDPTGLEDVTVQRAGLSRVEEEEKMEDDAPKRRKTSYHQSLRDNATHLVRRVDLIGGQISFRCQTEPSIFAFLRFLLKEKELGHCTAKVVRDLISQHNIKTLGQLKNFLFDRDKKPKEDKFLQWTRLLGRPLRNVFNSPQHLRAIRGKGEMIQNLAGPFQIMATGVVQKSTLALKRFEKHLVEDQRTMANHTALAAIYCVMHLHGSTDAFLDMHSGEFSVGNLEAQPTTQKLHSHTCLNVEQAMKLDELVDKLILGTAAKTCLTDLENDLNLTADQKAVLQKLDIQQLLSQSQVEVKFPSTSSLFDVSKIKTEELVECVADAADAVQKV